MRMSICFWLSMTKFYKKQPKTYRQISHVYIYCFVSERKGEIYEIFSKDAFFACNNSIVDFNAKRGNAGVVGGNRFG